MKARMKARVYRYCTCLVKTCKFHPHSTLCGARVMPKGNAASLVS